MQQQLEQTWSEPEGETIKRVMKEHSDMMFLTCPEVIDSPPQVSIFNECESGSRRRQDLLNPLQKAIQRNTYRHFMTEDDQYGLPFSHAEVDAEIDALEESKDEAAMPRQEE